MIVHLKPMPAGGPSFRVVGRSVGCETIAAWKEADLDARLHELIASKRTRLHCTVALGYISEIHTRTLSSWLGDGMRLTVIQYYRYVAVRVI